MTSQFSPILAFRNVIIIIKTVLVAPLTAILLQVNTLELMGSRAIAATRGTKPNGENDGRGR